ncbi:hypothetical protein [Variovorax gossypii]
MSSNHIGLVGVNGVTARASWPFPVSLLRQPPPPISSAHAICVWMLQRDKVLDRKLSQMLF